MHLAGPGGLRREHRRDSGLSAVQLRDGHLVLSPTDVTKHVACPHVTTLDLAVVDGELARPADGVDAQLQLIFDKGLEHEEDYLQELHRQGLRVVEIPDDRGLSLAEREALTIAAMQDGADVIYQATLFDGSWVGFADFLMRVERPSDLGAWSYDIADTKLARRLKVPALLQMATYAVRLEQLQGVPPTRLTVVAGDHEHHPWRLVDVDAYAARVRSRLVQALAERAPTEPVPTAYCQQCRWLPRCTAQWEAFDDLSLVAGMRSDQRLRLIEAGLSTLTALAEARAEDPRLAEALGTTSRTRLHRQARLQRQEQTTGTPAYRLWPAQPGQGLQLLPEPDPGDVYLDFEGDPFAPGGQGLEYLAGICDRAGEFFTWWAHDAAQERAMMADLLGWLLQRWREHPGMHVYHYANYEQAALKRLTAREGVAETELDMLLRGERFVDLYAVVRQGVQISKRSYSIKKLEGFYWGQTRSAVGDEVGDALSSVVEYERWASADRADDTILRRIADYNHDDVRSTLALHDWLEQRRDELAGTGASLERPGDQLVEESRDSERIEAENALADRLVAAGHGLLAGCVGWHRREDKQTWWEYYRSTTMSEEELIEDRLTLGGLSAPREMRPIKRSTVWRYDFPPQEARIGKQVDGARDHERVGEVVDLDLEEGWIEVKRGNATPAPAVTGLVTNGYVDNTPLRDALMRLGEATLAGAAGSAGTALLHRTVPAGLARREGESATQQVRRVGAGMSGQVLAVQGPPGSGKTYAGQHLIADLLDAGLRVGVTAPSHSVIGELMRKTGRPGLRKIGGKDHLPEQPEPDDPVALVADNATVEQALASGSTRLVGGTAWLWARAEMRAAVDVLVIDEAGQFSLANALAVAQAAGSVVLLGDPQQLAAPSSATHPYGAGVSVLEHLLDGAEVVPPDRGVFLDRTWRMHPEITRFVSTMSYADQLSTAPGREVQRVLGVPLLQGSGLRWVPVLHDGHSCDNPLEARVVADLVHRVLDGSWVDDHARTLDLTPRDVLVVAPYNAHVALVSSAVDAAVGAGVQVGTVDKFQGREAAVVIYTLASSSAGDAPRGIDFLYDTHRLNVAVSRARALAIIVGSPRLLEAPVHTPEQLRAVNALCRFVDAAEQVSP